MKTPPRSPDDYLGAAKTQLSYPFYRGKKPGTVDIFRGPDTTATPIGRASWNAKANRWEIRWYIAGDGSGRWSGSILRQLRDIVPTPEPTS
ncbi:hypothetical protein [Natronoglycomyces albus]|uniref:Uncharacterized protein n=1 Tax=Natronoglycomyces albus TaxID=2811108 RepID=A0A895XKY9_9ACTN|nr:hypothetical protein [Natronoglycomyces albus]QSB05994.1 hypothetical protein JQS30_03460 [Natronoglycomyces albus]